ncbi:MAG: C-GCAxxG-C-C family (seleno)protein, partial [Pseudomonadota bacterium]
MNRVEQSDDSNKKQLGDKAARLALEFRRQGFHCSESVFSAINTTLNITDPQMVRVVTGFHGGGGSRRKHPDVDLTDVLNKAASGLNQRPLEEIPIEVTGHLCGAIAAGIICIGMLFGRKRPTDDLTCVDELSFELHRRFDQKFGVKLCR